MTIMENKTWLGGVGIREIEYQSGDEMLLYLLLCFDIVVLESLFSIVKVCVLCVIVWHLVCF